MAIELTEGFKESLWNRPVCTDDSDPLEARERAKKDFLKAVTGELVAPDAFTVALDLDGLPPDQVDPD